MNWERAKTLMLLLLFVVNVALGSILLTREWRSQALERRAMEDLCDILERNGLTAKPEQIPDDLALTFDIERAPELDTDTNENTNEVQSVRGLPVWGRETGSSSTGTTFVPIAGNWLWSEGLPVDGTLCRSAAHTLLLMAEEWDEVGVLESCELGFAASPLTPGVLRLRPCWRFVISGREFFITA